MFPDSKIAQEYSCGRSKSTSLISELAEMKQEDIVQIVKTSAYSIATDGSNDVDAKQYPIVINFFSEIDQCIVSRVFAVPVCTGRATGENIYNLINDVITSRNIPYKFMLSIGSDNAPVMTGSKKGVYGFLVKQHKEIYLSGCPCHFINLAAEKACAMLSCKVDDFLIDLYYYLDKSSTRKELLRSLQGFFGTEQEKILKHCTTRWLSMGKCITRLLNQFIPVKEFIKKEKDQLRKVSTKIKPASDPKSSGSKSTVTKPKSFTELFGAPLQSKSASSSTNSATTSGNKCSSHVTLTDRAKHDTPRPKSSTSKDHKSSGSKRTSDGTVKSKAATSKTIEHKSGTTEKSEKTEDDSEYNVKVQASRLDRLYRTVSDPIFKLECLFLQFTVPLFDHTNLLLQSKEPLVHKSRKSLLQLLKHLMTRFVKPVALVNTELLEVSFHDPKNQRSDDDLMIGSDCRAYIEKENLSGEILKSFYARVRKYFIRACEYMIQKFPLKEKLLIEAQVCDVSCRSTNKFSSIRYFIERFPVLMPAIGNIDDLELEFAQFQCDSLTEDIEKTEREDCKWVKISQLKDDFGEVKYKFLPKVILGILTIFHSNAECERIFSFVRKNHTVFRSSLGNDTTENLMILKENSKECYNRSYDVHQLKRLKSSYSKTIQSYKKNN